MENKVKILNSKENYFNEIYPTWYYDDMNNQMQESWKFYSNFFKNVGEDMKKIGSKAFKWLTFYSVALSLASAPMYDNISVDILYDLKPIEIVYDEKKRLKDKDLFKKKDRKLDFIVSHYRINIHGENKENF